MRANVVRRGVAAGVLSAATVAGLTVAVAPAAEASGYWGAIAYSSNGAWGRVVDSSSKSRAQQVAVNYCGYTDCKPLTTFTDCGAVAESSTSYQGGTGPTLSAAMNDAQSRLPGSWIATWGCN